MQDLRIGATLLNQVGYAINGKEGQQNARRKKQSNACTMMRRNTKPGARQSERK